MRLMTRTIAASTLLALAACGGTPPQADEPPTPSPARAAAPARAAVALTALADPGPPVVTGEYAQVTGADPVLAGRINVALKAPIDRRTREYRRALDGQQGTVTVKPTLRLKGPRYVSVRYDIGISSKRLPHSTWQRARTVTVDLRTGRPVRAAQIFQRKWLIAQGLPELSRRLVAGFAGRSCLARLGQQGTLTIKRAAELDGPHIQLALLRDSLEVIVDTPYYGYETACGQPSAKIPFTELAGVLTEAVGG